MNAKNHYRFWEIDLLRGIAIIMMIIYHIIYDLDFLDLYIFNLRSLSFRIFLYPIGTIFLFLVGVSLSLSYQRLKEDLSGRQIFFKFIFRGLKIFFLGMLITIFTWFYLQEGFIVFGVLHCIGLSIILSIFLIRYRFLNLALGIIIVVIGIFLQTMTFNFDMLLWLGFTPSDFYTVDYFPILPWFGVILVGIFVGNIFYENHVRKFVLPDLTYLRMVRALCFLGQNSLIIYFLHQPIIIGLMQLYMTF